MYSKEQAYQARKEAIQHYGSECNFCGESHWEFLTIKPKSATGKLKRKQYGAASVNVYRWLRHRGYPTEHFYISCMNCTFSSRYKDKPSETKNKERSAWFKKYRDKLKVDTFKAYGEECVCCGESRLDCLTLDHPDGNGQADRKPHRKLLGQLYRYLRDNNWPRKDYYRVLCMNCNWVTRHKKICPHQIHEVKSNG